MVVEVKVPSVGESVTEALLAQWFKSDGRFLLLRPTKSL
jgi:pyruvate/2-oxoglutarate dehydrogenase complex dihydrolipoamide acyltransferase (E2) component